MYKWSINHFRGKVIWKMVALKLSIFIKILTAASCSAMRMSLPRKPCESSLLFRSLEKLPPPALLTSKTCHRPCKGAVQDHALLYRVLTSSLVLKPMAFSCTQFATRNMGKFAGEVNTLREIVQWRKSGLQLISLHFLISLSSCFVRIHP